MPSPIIDLIVPDQALVLGGVTVDIIGNFLDCEACSDDFSGNFVGAQWNPGTTGGGSVTETGGALHLDSGTTAAGSASITSASTVGDVLADLSFEAIGTPPKPNTPTAQVAMSLQVNGTTFATIAVCNGKPNFLRIRAEDDGVTLFDEQFTLSSFPGSIGFRRIGSELQFRQNGAVLATRSWTSLTASVSIQCNNNSENVRLKTDLTGYVRTPIILFAGQPASGTQVIHPTRLQTVVPAMPDGQPRLADVSIANCTSPPTVLSGGFTYLLEPNLLIVTEGTENQATITSDPTLQNATPGLPGQRLGST